MFGGRKALGLIAILFGLGVALVLGFAAYRHYHYKWQPVVLTGAVIRKDDDPMKDAPIADAEVSITGAAIAKTKSNFAGFFAIPLPRGVGRDQSITLHFSHPDYQPLDLTELVGDRLSIIRLAAIKKEAETQPDRPEVPITDIVIRYSTVTTNQENVGTAARTFQVNNTGDVPCDHRTPCSPNGKWAASIGSESLDAGEGSVFRNARVSCIAGPCPFTRIDYDGFSNGGRQIRVAVRNWSDTTTFLLQAEVFQLQIQNIVRTVYPVILGRSLNFTLPASAQGPWIEAQVNKEQIIFPLGSDLQLSWTDCSVNGGRNQAATYRCELRHGYKFQ